MMAMKGSQGRDKVQRRREESEVGRGTYLGYQITCESS